MASTSPIKHHADDATLMSYSAGTLGEALSAVVANHVAMCPQCRSELTKMDRVGGFLLSQIHTCPMVATAPPAPQLEKTTRDEGDHVLAAIERSGDMPGPLSRLAGSDLGSVRWRRLGYGVWHLPLALKSKASGDLRLIKVAPGQAIFEHGHGGTELTLILSGSYRDELGRFGVGDLADLDGEVEHRPVADKNTGCVCLIASEAKARFKNVIARMAQPFIGL